MYKLDRTLHFCVDCRHTSFQCWPDAADNMELKGLLQEGYFNNVRTTNTTPVHSGPRQLNLKAYNYLSTVADMGILAGARCLVAGGGGGFGLQARLWGGATVHRDGAPPPCFVTMEECVEKENMLQKHKRHSGGR